jgi:YVTN family beta-propeller protein
LNLPSGRYSIQELHDFSVGGEMRALRILVFGAGLVFCSFPVALAKTNYAYVANATGTTVSVINTSTNAVVKTVTVGANPFAITVDQAGKNVYVGNETSNSVSVISTSTNGVVATIPVGAFPHGIAISPNGKTLYVSNNSGASVSVVNTSTKKVTATIAVGTEPSGMAVLPNGAFLYVVNYSAGGPGSVSVISTLTNAVVATVPVGSGPIWAASSSDGSTVYVTNYFSGSVSVIRTADNSVINTISITAASPYGDAVSPDGHWLYVSGNGEVTVIDTNTLGVAATIPIGAGEYAIPSFTEDSAFAYVSEPGANSVTVINTATKSVIGSVAVGSGPGGVALMGLVHVATVAGGYVGDKGPATSAALEGPGWSVLDGAGNLYVSDPSANRIRKVSTSGTITTYAGTGICGYNGENIAATMAMVCNPGSLVFDASGNLIVAEPYSGRIRKITKTGKITTIAGTGVPGYGGDGGPATSAQIGFTADLLYDSSGNLYAVDILNCVVRRIATNGTISTFAGTGTCGYNGDGIPATTAQLKGPRGLAIDSSGNVYISDSTNHRVRKVGTGGTITTFAGNGQNGFSGDNGLATSAQIGVPRGLAIHNNALYIANAGSFRYRYVDLTTNKINTYAGSVFGYDGDGHSLTATEFALPRSILFDSSGNPIFDDVQNGRVRKATGGIVNTIAGGFLGDGNLATSAALVLPEALAIDKTGNIFIADQTGNRVRRVSGGKISTVAGNGISGYSGDGGLGTGAMLYAPQGVTVDSADNVFIAATRNKVIRKVDTSGNITTFATNANFAFLLQMSTDSSNNIYVADTGACVVWKITPGGVITIAAGVLFTCGYNGDGIAATTAQLNGPYSVAFDSAGNMYVTDSANNRVREVNTAGVISTIAGDGNCNDTGDGGSATAAELCPNSVAVDKSGTIYVADIVFGNIRKIKGGIITTFAGAGYGPYGNVLFNGDGLWPLYTNFDDPIAIAVDSKGTVYELDDYDHRVRRIQ